MEYVHGGDIYTHKGMTDFSVNLNPFGPGRAVVEAARKSMDQNGNYPDASSRKLKSALAKRLEVPAEHIICGNGAADLIFTAVLADCPRKALIPVPAFAEYEQALRATGCEICYYKKREATGFQLEEDFLDLLNEDIDMVFLCSPDNPTGKLIDRSMLWKILARCETYGIRMVLDECFIDFAENAATASILADTKRWRTLFILRSLTKMHAIPGIRIGYAVTSDMEFLEKMEPDENLGEVQIADEGVAIIAGLAAMEVEGVSSMAGNATRELIAKLGMKSLSKGVKVDVLDGIVTVTLALNMSYGYSIKDITAKVQEKVKAAIENMTGLEVADVNIRVAGVDVPEEA